MRNSLLITVVAVAMAAASAGPASAATPPLSDARTAVHFDLAAGQTPENFVVEPNGSVVVTFVGSRQVAHVALDGRTDVLATLPLPEDGARTPPSPAPPRRPESSAHTTAPCTSPTPPATAP